MRRLALYDRVYMFSALAVLATGLLRLTLGAKGAAFYMSNPWFHAKITLFIVIGLCSIPPTLSFLRWQKQARQQPGFVPSEPEIRRARRWVMIESHLFILLPLCGADGARHRYVAPRQSQSRRRARCPASARTRAGSRRVSVSAWTGSGATRHCGRILRNMPART